MLIGHIKLSRVLMDNFFNSLAATLRGIESYHDSYTAPHELRTGYLVHLLSLEIGMSKEESEHLKLVSSIHDIGKVAIPAPILEKPSALTTFERKTIEMHCNIGCDIVKKIKHPLSKLAQIVTLTHHENFDGTGYPQGLKGQNIPLAGRICRICDVYDALTSSRPYRLDKNYDHAHEETIQFMTNKNKDGMFYKFDPELLEAFLGLKKEAYKNLYQYSESINPNRPS